MAKMTDAVFEASVTSFKRGRERHPLWKYTCPYCAEWHEYMNKEDAASGLRVHVEELHPSDEQILLGHIGVRIVNHIERYYYKCPNCGAEDQYLGLGASVRGLQAHLTMGCEDV